MKLSGEYWYRIAIAHAATRAWRSTISLSAPYSDNRGMARAGPVRTQSGAAPSDVEL